MLLTSDQLVESAKTHIKEISSGTLLKLLNDVVVIDVREKEECKSGLIPNAYNIPRGVLEMNVQQYLHQKMGKEDIIHTAVVLYCHSGARSALATQSLQAMGFTHVQSLEGGMAGWIKANYPLDGE
ncbi:rhodanese-like domain-containing protein [Enterovibrio sp. FF113]|uniref:rhodanese-like domain-containing protein n=1 Tax=Enterovibrio sp. FF113 TaxID=3230010 RepID=UPI00352EF406